MEVRARLKKELKHPNKQMRLGEHIVTEDEWTELNIEKKWLLTPEALHWFEIEEKTVKKVARKKVARKVEH